MSYDPDRRSEGLEQLADHSRRMAESRRQAGQENLAAGWQRTADHYRRFAELARQFEQEGER